MIIDWNLTTGGTGLWSKKQATVRCTKITPIHFNDNDLSYGRIMVWFDLATWNPDTDGLIYTDREWLAALRLNLKQAGFSQAAVNTVDYSEQGMQGDDYVDLDVALPFLGEWEQLNK